MIRNRTQIGDQYFYAVPSISIHISKHPNFHLNSIEDWTDLENLTSNPCFDWKYNLKRLWLHLAYFISLSINFSIVSHFLNF